MKKLLNGTEEILMAIVLLTMVFINFINVLSRYLLHTSWATSEELLTYMFVALVFLGAARGIRESRHPNFSFLPDRLPDNIKKKLETLSVFTGIVLFSVVGVYASRMVIDEFRYAQKTPALGIPEWLVGSFLPLGCFLLVYRLAVKYFKKGVENKK